MCSFGTNEYISRVVAEYSDMLLHIALTRLHAPSKADPDQAAQFLADTGLVS